MPWVTTRPGLPYFVTEDGAAWTPIGANDAVSWPELAPLFRRRDPEAVERHLRWLAAHGVTCIRLMLEYAQGDHRYLERRVGTFAPNMVRFWDDLFPMLERTGIRVLLTPFDTFFMSNRWRHHPYNARNGGPCRTRRQWLTCPQMRAAVKRRLAFATDRWGGSGALFAWDLWNEIHTSKGEDDPAALAPFISDLGTFLRERELRLYGRAHPQTVSIFGPHLIDEPATVDPIFRHPLLDFASTHLYEAGTIDDPRDTVAPALATARLMQAAVEEASDGRPVHDSEHGPIHSFKDRHVTLPEPFDDEMFRHMQWAHLASGGAGGGMRWPNRHPHVLTPGMRRTQRSLAAFLPLIDWTCFRRRNLAARLHCDAADTAAIGCGDAAQAVVWLLRTSGVGPDGRLARREPRPVSVTVPGLAEGRYRVTCFDTEEGVAGPVQEVTTSAGLLRICVPLDRDLALAIRASARSS
ncbi:hypothetical protein EYB45_08745 [Erythrobacteraceae bacterium CFH 75059]|nr:hypothetical protein EYB45_08745 [Erythrobacteraceae bacterium CFH 75059]